MACKHYYALFGSKWSYSMQKNQNSFFQWSGHCALEALNYTFLHPILFKYRLSIIPFEKILIGVWMTFGTCGQQLIRTEFSPRVSFLMDKMSNSSLLIVQFLMNGSQGGQKSRLLKILLLLGSNKGHFKMISSEDH